MTDSRSISLKNLPNFPKIKSKTHMSDVRLGLNLGEVGKVFQRDRTTVGHACRLIEDRRDDEQVDFLINCLERAVEEWLQIAHHRPVKITSGVENERS